MTESDSSSVTSANVDAASVPTMSFARPIIYGNVAYALKKPENEHTHRWTVYVKAFDDGEDISLYVKKVIFKLHDSFQQPNRVVDKPPFQVTETGWGEFQIQIKVYFHDAPEKPVALFHNLRLYEAGEDLETQIKNDCPPVVVEHYDEVIFDPAPSKLVPLLQEASEKFPVTSSIRYNKLKMDEAAELDKLRAVLRQVEAEIAAASTK